MPDQVQRAVREERAHRAAALCAETRAAYLQSRIGAAAEVLFEQPDDSDFCGYDMQYCPVRVTGTGLSGQVHSVRITGADGDGLRGELL